MGVRSLQSYIISKFPECQSYVVFKPSCDKKKKLIVVDGWNCIRSVYGSHIDFICGGQWQEYRASIRRFVDTFQQAGCELVVFFSGTVEATRKQEWSEKQSVAKDVVNTVMHGIRQRAQPPDKKNFLPNETHAQVFRQVLLSCHVKIISTPFSCERSLVEYALANNAYGVLANDSTYILINAPCFLSLQHLKVSSNNISTVEISRDKILELSQLSQAQLPLLVCLTKPTYNEFHKSLCKDQDKENTHHEHVLDSVMEFLKALPDSLKSAALDDNLPELVSKMYPDKEEGCTEVVEELKSELSFYKTSGGESDNAPSTVVTVRILDKIKEKECPTPKETEVNGSVNDESSDDKIKEAQIISGDDKDEDETVTKLKDATQEITESLAKTHIEDTEKKTPKYVSFAAVTPKVLQSAKTAHTGGTLNTHLYPLMCTGTLTLGPIFEDFRDKELPSSSTLFRPARQRIYGLVFGIGRGVTKPDNSNKRQRNTKIDSERQVIVKEYIVTCSSTKSKLIEAEDVPGIPVHSVNKQPPRKPTPHIDRLWIGMNAKVQELRRITFLAIMNCNIPSFINPAVIANEYLLVSMVLRYILTTGSRMLREYELDAFLATALSPQLQFGPSNLYKINPGRLGSRGCSLANIFVRGIETALLANDACAYPLPLRFCFIGNFFDGKLFQIKLAQTRAGLSLLDVCDGELYAVDYLRHLRCVITEDLPRTIFAPPPHVPRNGNVRGGGMRPPRPMIPMMPPHHVPAERDPGMFGRGRPVYRGQGRGQYRAPYNNMPPNFPPPMPPHPQGGVMPHYNSYGQPIQPSSYSIHSNGQYNPPSSDGNYNKSNYSRNGNYNGAFTQYKHRPPEQQYMMSNGEHVNPNYNGNTPNYNGNTPNNSNPHAYMPRSGDYMSNNRGNTVYNNNAAPFSKVPLYKEHPYGKRSIPERSDTKQWINFLGN